MLRSLIFTLWLLIFFVPPTLAQTDTLVSDVNAELVVGLTEMPPFVIKDKDNLWDGISVQLWREVADELNIIYRFEEVPADSLVPRVARGTLDMGLLSTITAEKEQRVDFSYAYYQTTLGVAGSSTRSIMKIVQGIFTQRFLYIMLGLSVLLLVVGTIIWLVERAGNEEQFGGERNIWQGIGSGFWWAGVTMTTIGYGDKAPVTFWGRAVALLWMLVAMAVTASLTATLVDTLGESGGISVPGDLRQRQVGSMDETDAAEYLREERIRFQAYDSVPTGLRAVQQQDINAFVHSTAVLRYWVNEDANLSVKVEAKDMIPHRYAFVLPPDSPLREPINQTMLEAINGAGWQAVLERYVPRVQ